MIERILSVIFVLAVFAGCENESVEPDSNELYAPYLMAKRNSGEVTLTWEKPICLFNSYWQCPQKDPEYFEVLISDNEPSDLHIHSKVNKDIFGITIGNLVNGNAYYFAIRSVGKWGQSALSNTIMTIPGPRENVQNLLPTANRSREYGTLSSDQKFLAYVSDYTWNDGQNSVQSVFISDLSTSVERLIEKSAFAPEWSPLEQKIVYQTSNGEQNTTPGYLPTHISIYDPQSDSYKRLTQGNSFNFMPTWSPDGKWIAYLSDSAAGNEYNIWKVSVDGDMTIQISSDFGDLDDAEFAIIDDRSPHKLTWSPDGETIAFDRLVKTEKGFVFDIYSIPSSGGDISTLLSSQWVDFCPAYSPDGSYLAFISNRSGSYEIWTVDLQSNELRQITGSTNLWIYGNPDKIEWSDSGNEILFTGNEDSYSTVYWVKIN